MVGVAAFLASVWRGHLDESPTTCAAAVAVAVASSCAPKTAPRTAPRNSCLTLMLPAQLFAWVSYMATEHNLGSVHKSVRDLLEWAAECQDEDLDWIFGRTHTLHVQQLKRQLEKKELVPTDYLEKVDQHVPVGVRLSAVLQRWIDRCVSIYGLEGPSQVFDAVCRCAIELEAAEDIFQSYSTGHDLPRCTADLYYDLGIKTFSSSAPPPCVTPPDSPQYVAVDCKVGSE